MKIVRQEHLYPERANAISWCECTVLKGVYIEFPNNEP